MSDETSKTWGDVVEKLRSAVDDLRTATGRAAAPSADEETAAATLRSDMTRLEQSAADLRSKLASGLDTTRSEFETAFDRERAEQSAGHLKAALDDLAGLTRTVTRDLRAAAESSFTVAQPEIRSAVRALEDVAGSAGAWVRAVIDPDAAPRDDRSPDSSRPRGDSEETKSST